MSARPLDPRLDITVSRIIRAPRAAVWRAWADPARFEKWWVPEPGRTRVVEMDLTPGGAFVTEYSEDGAEFGPHLAACFLAVDQLERIVFTDTLLGGWRPAEKPFMSMTAIMTFADHPDGTHYTASAMHRTPDDRQMHETMGFHDGWGTVTAQLARLVEGGAGDGA